MAETRKSPMVCGAVYEMQASPVTCTVLAVEPDPNAPGCSRGLVQVGLRQQEVIAEASVRWAAFRIIGKPAGIPGRKAAKKPAPKK